MKKRNFLYLLLLLNQLAESRQFQTAASVKKAIESANGNVELVKRALDESPTFNFPVECSIYNAYSQTTWLGSAEDIEGDEAEYSISCAKHETIEGGSGQFEATLVINSRATKKAHLFTNSKRKPYYHLHTENPLHGKACKLMAEYNKNPLIVLKDSPSDLYYFSEILLDEKGNVGDVISLTRYSFNANDIIHHVASHQGRLYVFHSYNTFGQDETSRVTVLDISLDSVQIVDGKKEQVVDGKVVKGADGKPVMVDNTKSFTRHKIIAAATKQIDRSEIAFVGEGKAPLARLGSEIKTVVHDNKLFAAFSVTPKRGNAACGLVTLDIEKKPEPEPEPVEEPGDKAGDGKDTKSKDGKPSKVADAKGGQPNPSEDAKSNLAGPAVNGSTGDSEEGQGENSDDSNESEERGSEIFEIKEDDLEHEVVIVSVAPGDADPARLPFCTVNGSASLPKELAIMSTSTAVDYLMYAAGNQVSVIPVDKKGIAIIKGSVDDFYSNGRFISRKHKRGGDASALTTLTLPYEIEGVQVVGDTIYIKDKTRQGVYSYRALFDENGSIADWCDSEHFVTAEDENIRLVSGQKAYSWYGVRGNSSYSYNQTTWEETTKSMEEFVDAVKQSLPQNISGVQGLVSLSCNKLYEQRELLVATGYNHAVYGYVTGKSAAFVDAQVVTLPEAGALVTAEIAGSLEGKQEWLLLGGVGGLYAYASNDGSGFGTVNGIDDLFLSERSWKKIGNFSFVRKVIKDKHHEDIVYVVTSQGIHKVAVNKHMFAAPQIEKIFDSSILGGRFDYVSDVMVDQEFAIVGTSKGIYIIEDMNDASQTYRLELDGSVGSVNQITALKGSKKFDNVYILSTNQQKQVSLVHRIVVRNKECTLFADCTHQHGNDDFGIRGAFLSMESTCSSFYSNGSWNVKMNYPYKNERKAIMFYTSGIRSGIDTIRTANRNNLSNMYLSCVEGSENIAGMVHNSALGCWIIFGDFGLRILS